MADETTTNIAVFDTQITSALGMPENQIGPNIIPLIAPEVQVYNRYFSARVFGKDRFKKVVQVARPRGGSAEKIVRTTKEPKTFEVAEKTLRDVLDRRDIVEAANAPDGGFDLRAMVALDIAGQLHTTIEAGVADMFLASANYASGAKAAISTTFTGTTTLSLLLAQRDALIKRHAILADTLIVTPELWADIIANTNITNKFQYTTSASLTEEMLAAYLQIRRVIVPRSVWYDTDETGAWVWSGKKALLIAAPQNPGMNGPAFAKTFFRMVNGVREEARTGFDLDGNEHFIIAREEETAIVFNDAAFLWY